MRYDPHLNQGRSPERLARDCKIFDFVIGLALFAVFCVGAAYALRAFIPLPH